jgi:hypothetical protein
MKKFCAFALTAAIGALLLTPCFSVNDWRFYLAMTIGLSLQVWQAGNWGGAFE